MGGKPCWLSSAGNKPLGRSARGMQAWRERAAPERYGCGAMQATKRPGLVEKSPGEETKRRKPCGKLHPYHVIPCIPRLITGVNGIETEGALSLSIRILPEHGIYPCHAQGMQQTHCGYPASSQEPQRVDGAERSCHLQDFVESIAVNVGGLQQEGEGAQSTNACCQRRRRQSTRSRGKPGTGESCDPFPRNGLTARDEGLRPYRSLITWGV
jgi:hypothetical protein